MRFNPFLEKYRGLEDSFESWADLTSKPFNNALVSPYTKIRLDIALALESSARDLVRAYMQSTPDYKLRRELALIRHIDSHCAIRLKSLIPIEYSATEKTLIHELSEISILAMCAQNEINKTVKSSLNFILVEDFDHIYRLINLFKSDKISGKIVDELGDWLGWRKKRGDIRFEIMPGRPTVSQHRFPYDDVRKYVEVENSLVQTRLNIILSGAVQEYGVESIYAPDSSGILFSELSSIEQQHSTHIDTLRDPNTPFIERLLTHKFCECYVYKSLHDEENERLVRAQYAECLEKKIAQINFARHILRAQNRDYQEILGDALLPPPFSFEDSYERNTLYIRHVLKNITDNTQVAGEFLKADDLTKSYIFFRHNSLVNAPVERAPSHIAVNRHIEEFGEDFRVEESAHPVAALRSRTRDNTEYAR